VTEPRTPSRVDRRRHSTAQSAWGLKLIILYKFAKAPIMLAIAVWLTVAPSGAHRALDSLAADLAEGGATLARAGDWIQANLTSGVLVGGAVLAWLDGLSTAIEGILLLSGRSWAEWVVIVGLGALLPLEILSLGRRPGPLKWIVLGINLVVVMYLVRRRVLMASRE
jgi:uncharacterized membrane protein (DUF2068 family)